VDCSGLVQRAAWMSDSVWLPRHSSALLGAGSRIPPSHAARADVLVLQRRKEAAPARDRMPASRSGPAHAMHVAIVDSPSTAIHASRDAWVVVREPLDGLVQRYRIRGVRRLTSAEGD
jgi:cell wall-associated NlpC family hydrolase